MQRFSRIYICSRCNSRRDARKVDTRVKPDYVVIGEVGFKTIGFGP